MKYVIKFIFPFTSIWHFTLRLILYSIFIYYPPRHLFLFPLKSYDRYVAHKGKHPNNAHFSCGTVTVLYVLKFAKESDRGGDNHATDRTKQPRFTKDDRHFRDVDASCMWRHNPPHHLQLYFSLVSPRRIYTFLVLVYIGCSKKKRFIKIH